MTMTKLPVVCLTEFQSCCDFKSSDFRTCVGDAPDRRDRAATARGTAGPGERVVSAPYVTWVMYRSRPPIYSGALELPGPTVP